MITYQIESWNSYYRDAEEINRQDYEEIWPLKDRMPLKPNVEYYEKLEKLGRLLVFTVRDEGKLIGFHISIYSNSSHSSDTICSYQDACYLHPKYRGFIGVRMLMKAEIEAKAKGAQVLIWSTPVAKDSGKLLEAMGFHETDKLYRKWIGD